MNHIAELTEQVKALREKIGRQGQFAGLSAMTAAEEFKRDWLPAIARQYESDGFPDNAARRQAWNEFIDHLIRDARVSGEEADRWDAPYWLEWKTTR